MVSNPYRKLLALSVQVMGRRVSKYLFVFYRGSGGERLSNDQLKLLTGEFRVHCSFTNIGSHLPSMDNFWDCSGLLRSMESTGVWVCFSIPTGLTLDQFSWNYWILLMLSWVYYCRKPKKIMVTSLEYSYILLHYRY